MSLVGSDHFLSREKSMSEVIVCPVYVNDGTDKLVGKAVVDSDEIVITIKTEHATEHMIELMKTGNFYHFWVGYQFKPSNAKIDFDFGSELDKALRDAEGDHL